jgi:hypothetical protein
MPAKSVFTTEYDEICQVFLTFSCRTRQNHLNIVCKSADYTYLFKSRTEHWYGNQPNSNKQTK